MSQLEKLGELIETEQAKTSFACGGSISVRTDNNDSDVSWATIPGQPMRSRPINIFWASKDDKDEVHKVTLPTEGDEKEKTEIKTLAGDCSPASFGRGGEDVLDESYRRAGKMELKDFATSFHPADFGLVQNIEQTLLPSVLSDEENSFQHRGLIAELYKLNVYSGPSGHFKAHVDTPRSDTQIGSLVVCLPSEFKGGNLLVRHGEDQIDFDWAPSSRSDIQWAAFYSDCEHEIKEVTDGHRITLTYNLHAVHLVGGALFRNPAIDAKSLPLYGLIESLMKEPDMKTKGNVLGIYCSHAYAHTSKIAEKRLPQHLKGSDLIIYAIFKHLGYSVFVLPVLELNEEFDVVGTKLHSHTDVSDYDESEEEYPEEALRHWPHKRLKDIVWLNGPKHGEKALTYLTYGNQASLDWAYSHAAIIVMTGPESTLTELPEAELPRPSWEEDTGSENN